MGNSQSTNEGKHSIYYESSCLIGKTLEEASKIIKTNIVFHSKNDFQYPDRRITEIDKPYRQIYDNPFRNPFHVAYVETDFDKIVSIAPL